MPFPDPSSPPAGHDDPHAYRLAVGAVALVALIHGLYNSLPSIGLATLLDLAALFLTVRVFLFLVESSPYLNYSLEHARSIGKIKVQAPHSPNTSIKPRALAP